MGQKDSTTNFASESPFLKLLFETKPMDSSADSRVVLHLEPLEVVYLPSSFRRITEFIAVPNELSSLNDVAAAAAATAGYLQEQTTASLMYAVGKVVSLFDIKMDIE